MDTLVGIVIALFADFNVTSVEITYKKILSFNICHARNSFKQFYQKRTRFYLVRELKYLFFIYIFLKFYLQINL